VPDPTRTRERRGQVTLIDGVPFSNPSSTLSLLPDAATARWLAAQAPLVRGRLLDNGCGNQPYRAWYEPLVDSVVTLDAAPAPGVAVVGFADRLPFADQSFDTVLATEVLEHVENSERAASELLRVLRPGGCAIITVPFLYPTHEAPHDFRRFTHYGLVDLLARNGFEVLSVAAKGGPGLLVGQWAVLAITQALGSRVQHPLVRELVARPQQLFVQRRSVRLAPTGLRAIVSLGYMAVGRRPL